VISHDPWIVFAGNSQGRDALTKIVLETLEQTRIEPGNLPVEIKEMLGMLPGEIHSEVESDWMKGDGGQTL
jgi:uncharacterized iron-regulated protein